MKTIILLLALFPTVAFAVVGQRNYTFKDQTRNRTLSTFVWYPAAESAKPKALSKPGLFQPVIAAQDAPMLQKDKYPVVLLSHGSGGTADKLFWITEQLVKNDFIVVAVNHPGNMFGDNSGKGLIEVWLRPVDLSFALDKVSKLQEFKDRIDLTRVAAVGHSAGGTTALLLAGARLSPKNFKSPVPHCKGTKDPYFARWCSEIERLDLKKYATEVGKDYGDKRVKAAVALDPGYAQSFTPDAFVKIKDKTYVFIAEKLFAPTVDEIYSKEFLNLVGKESSEIVPESVHFSFLQACNANFPKDDPEMRELCANNELKITIQGKTAQKTVEYLNSKLL